jgi:hypothetical protein
VAEVAEATLAVEVEEKVFFWEILAAVEAVVLRM